MTKTKTIPHAKPLENEMNNKDLRFKENRCFGVSLKTHSLCVLGGQKEIEVNAHRIVAITIEEDNSHGTYWKEIKVTNKDGKEVAFVIFSSEEITIEKVGKQ